MKQTLEKLHHYETIDRASACELLLQVTSGYCNEAEIAAFISVFKMRNSTIEELNGFRDAMMMKCIPMDTKGQQTLDIVGTGGDGKNTFNISTTSAMVVAGCGIKVTKHGNHAATSISGSSDVLQYLGYSFTTDNDVLNRQLDEANICFLHAPLFHSAMKHVSATRQHLGLRTLFNTMGPICNPAQPKAQTLGVSHLSLIRTYHYLLQETGQQYCIAHSLDGYDEISLTGKFKIVTPTEEQMYHPEDLNQKIISPEALHCGSSVKDAAVILLNILTGKGTKAQMQVVVANSAFAIRCAKPELSLQDCMEMATASIVSGNAYQSFKKIIKH